MGYDRQKILEKTKRLIKEKNLFFIEDIVSYLAISKVSFYKFFPIGSEEMDEIKQLIDENKIQTSQAMLGKWFDSENPTLQIALYKLICSEEKRKMLSTNYTDVTTKGEAINPPRILFTDDYEDLPNDEEEPSDNEMKALN